MEPLTATEENFLRDGRTVDAIKSVRDRTGLSIADSKAVIDRFRAFGNPPPFAPPTSDAERRFWESSCTAALSSLTAKVGDLFSSGAEFRECATRAADIADAATVEWRKRWGAK